MLIGFLQAVRAADIPASVPEWLDLLALLEQDFAFADLDAFYALSRTCLVKDEKYFDRFDRAFDAYFTGLHDGLGEKVSVPDDWFADLWFRQKQQQCDNPDFDEFRQLLEQFHQRLQEQDAPHHCGPKWIGTGGTSAFGHSGEHEQGLKLADAPGQGQATKLWQQRQFKNLDDRQALEFRSLQMALRRLRRLTRSARDMELDLPGTIKETARQRGLLDLQWQPQRQNSIKLLLLIDVGGSMWSYVKSSEQLFAAARREFKSLKHFYFHNFFYDHLWVDNDRRLQQRESLAAVIQEYAPEYRVMIIGDATMGISEIIHKGGCIEFWNEEPGQVWFERLTHAFPKLAWLNPRPQPQWEFSSSLALINQLVQGRMYPLSKQGIDQAVKALL